LNKEEIFSIIIPTFNRQEIVFNTIQYLSNQTNSNFEVIIIDQTDGFKRELNDFKSENFNYRYFNINEIGLPNARNYGADKALGDILIFLDDDSIPDINIVENYKKLFQSLGSKVLIGGRVIEKGTDILKERNNICGGWITWYGKTLKNFDTDNSGECEWAPGGNFALSKKLFFQVGGFDTNFIGNALLEDGDFGYAVKKSGGRVYYQPESIIEHIRAPMGGVRLRNPNKNMFYRAHNTVYFFRKYDKHQFLFFVFIYLYCVALKDYFNKKHRAGAFFWTSVGFYKGFTTNIKK